MANSGKQTKKRRQSSTRVARSSRHANGFRSSDISLQGYFRSIGANNTMDAEKEAAQSKALFDLERSLWAEIIGTRVLLPVVKKAVSGEVGDRDAGDIMDLLNALSKRAKATADGEQLVENLAGRLRDLDEDRALVAHVLDYLRKNARLNGRKRGGGHRGRRERIRHIAGEVTRAKHEFIRGNLGLVVNIAKRYHVDQMSLSDLIQEGNLGLMRAVDKFDYRKGFRFSTYASWWIRSYISRAIVRKSNTVRIPEYMLRDRNRIKRTDEAHKAKAGRSLNEEELASELGLSKKRLQRTLRHDVSFVESLDREMPGNDNQKYIDFLADENGKSPLEMASFNDWLRNIPRTLEHLSVVERFVICWRFGLLDGDEMTLQEIGQCLSLSRERIRQIQEEALSKLRDQMEVPAA